MGEVVEHQPGRCKNANILCRMGRHLHVIAQPGAPGFEGPGNECIESAGFVLKRTKSVDGFYGASSTERLPTEVAIKEQMLRFTSVEF